MPTPKEKKKKKKRTHLERSLSNASISEKNRPSAATKKEKKLEKLKRSSAGVLFSGEKAKNEEGRTKGSRHHNGTVLEEWQVPKKSKGGRAKVETSELYAFSSDLKRGKIILDGDVMGGLYPQQYYTDVPYDHGAVYGRDCFDIDYKNIGIYDYNSEGEVNEAYDEVYIDPLDYNGPVVSDYYSKVGEGGERYSPTGKVLKNGSHLEDDVDSSFLNAAKPPSKMLAKARSCAEFRTHNSTAFKGRTKLRSDNWEWYSSQPSRLLSNCAVVSTGADLVSNSSSDSSVRSKGLIIEPPKDFYKHEKKKKKKNKSIRLTNGETG